MDFFKQQHKSKVVIVDSAQLDFVERKEDFHYLIEILNTSFDKKINYK